MIRSVGRGVRSGGSVDRIHAGGTTSTANTNGTEKLFDNNRLKLITSPKTSSSPEVRGMVQARLIESISRRGEELQAGLPPIWREALDKALETFLKAGRSPEDIAGARLAVSELIRERLLG